MEQHIGIAVSERMLIVRDIDAAEPQGSAGPQAMGIFAQANSKASIRFPSI